MGKAKREWKMITFKDQQVEDAYHVFPMHMTLAALMSWLMWGLRLSTIVVTEGWRVPRHPDDLHGTIPRRATDIRSWIYSDPYMIEERINESWIYDPERSHMMVAKIHDSGQGIHFHLQTHPNTVFLGALPNVWTCQRDFVCTMRSGT